MKTENTEQKKKGRTKAIWIALGVTATSVLGYLGWKHFSKKQINQDDLEEEPEVKTSSASSSSGSSSGGGSTSSWIPSTATRKDEFPLKKGSKGERVKEVQEALIFKYGKSVLPRYGADGDFGSEMTTALQKNGFPTQIDESTYNVIIKSGAPSSGSLAAKLGIAIKDKNYSNALALVRQIRNVKDYENINVEFKKFYLLDTKATIVGKLLEAFSSTSQKDTLRIEFLRIGLKFDGTYWTLSGITEQNLLVTSEESEAIDPKHNIKIKVPKGMLIGKFLMEKDGWTFFRTLEKNKKLVIKTNTVKFYERN